jgi:UPF0042 nucleotide-binding protein
MKLIIVSGLSGSGKSVALNTLEDLGYYCIDNLPLGLLPAFAQELANDPCQSCRKAAVAIDARNRTGDLRAFPQLLNELEGMGLTCETFFLQAEDDTLLKRFSETRRKHPLSGEKIPLAEAIRLEHTLLEPISSRADMFIDTTHTNVHQLRELVSSRVTKDPAAMSVLFQSFGYKHGIPSDADFVFDVRCLPNPHWEPRLRPLSGRDREVAEFLEAEPGVQEMFADLVRFLDAWIPRFQAGNRSYLTIAVGCTGGQHRSVYLVERLAEHFDRGGANVTTRHRELS